MCTVLLPPGGYPVAVNKYVISFVLTKGHFSIAVVPAGIFGEGKQPTDMTCNYERQAEIYTHCVQNAGFRRTGGLRWLSLNSNKLNTYLLMSRKLH